MRRYGLTRDQQSFFDVGHAGCDLRDADEVRCRGIAGSFATSGQVVDDRRCRAAERRTIVTGLRRKLREYRNAMVDPRDHGNVTDTITALLAALTFVTPCRSRGDIDFDSDPGLAISLNVPQSRRTAPKRSALWTRSHFKKRIRSDAHAAANSRHHASPGDAEEKGDGDMGLTP